MKSRFQDRSNLFTGLRLLRQPSQQQYSCDLSYVLVMSETSSKATFSFLTNYHCSNWIFSGCSCICLLCATSCFYPIFTYIHSYFCSHFKVLKTLQVESTGFLTCRILHSQLSGSYYLYHSKIMVWVKQPSGRTLVLTIWCARHCARSYGYTWQTGMFSAREGLLRFTLSVISAIATAGHMARLECSTSGDSVLTEPVSPLPKSRISLNSQQPKAWHGALA